VRTEVGEHEEICDGENSSMAARKRRKVREHGYEKTKDAVLKNGF
jgi:hypothetical protein